MHLFLVEPLISLSFHTVLSPCLVVNLCITYQYVSEPTCESSFSTRPRFQHRLWIGLMFLFIDLLYAMDYEGHVWTALNKVHRETLSCLIYKLTFELRMCVGRASVWIGLKIKEPLRNHLSRKLLVYVSQDESFLCPRRKCFNWFSFHVY